MRVDKAGVDADDETRDPGWGAAAAARESVGRPQQPAPNTPATLPTIFALQHPPLQFPIQ